MILTYKLTNTDLSKYPHFALAMFNRYRIYWNVSVGEIKKKPDNYLPCGDNSEYAKGREIAIFYQMCHRIDTKAEMELFLENHQTKD